MNSQERLMAQLRELCAEPGPEDGAPRCRRDRERHGESNTLRLAGRVARTVSLALGASDDPVLSGLLVLGGEPFPDASCIMVRVCAPGVVEAVMLEAVHARLRVATGMLRDAVALHLNRRKTPRLRFVIEPCAEGSP